MPPLSREVCCIGLSCCIWFVNTTRGTGYIYLIQKLPLGNQSINKAAVWGIWHDHCIFFFPKNWIQTPPTILKKTLKKSKAPLTPSLEGDSSWVVRRCPLHQSSSSETREGRQNGIELLSAKCQTRLKREAPRWLGLLKALLSRATAWWLISSDVSFYPVSH